MKTIGIDELNILVVEPSAIQHRIITGHLVACGVQHVQRADDGGTALDIMGGMMPDLVVSALYLPDMTGTVLVERMRDDEHLQTIPFMLISSETNFRYLDPVRQAGAVAVLPKPFQQAQLEKALYTTLDFLAPATLRVGDLDAEDLSVLIVDDSRFARGHIRRTLEGFGIEKISEAENGRAAIDLIRQQLFDFIVTDYNMPEMSGDQLVEYIRTQSDQPDIPILMVSSEADLSRLAGVEQGGVSALCDKPFEAGVVRELICKIMG